MVRENASTDGKGQWWGQRFVAQGAWTLFWTGRGPMFVAVRPDASRCACLSALLVHPNEVPPKIRGFPRKSPSVNPARTSGVRLARIQVWSVFLTVETASGIFSPNLKEILTRSLSQCFPYFGRKTGSKRSAAWKQEDLPRSIEAV